MPYNFHLLKTFNCHINIEYCATITSIKYLFLYHFKGEDLVTIEAEKLRDEIGIFQARKYISACYASWGVAEMPMTSIKPSVHQLLLHLPDEQTCTYQPNLRSAEESLKRKNFTMLTEYFAANNIYGELTQSLKYEDFPITFVWNDEGKLWTPRQRQASDPEGIGRKVSIHPTSGHLLFTFAIEKSSRCYII